jgi:aspartyl-tRNA(Asn)/glutamyl-tRNA(Gln) amidotransferase subunit A
MDYSKLEIQEISKGIKEKLFSAQEVTSFFIERIKEKNNQVFSFLEVDQERALKQAKKIDQEQEKPVLAGVPVALKDNIMVKGMKCTAGSKMLENYIAPYNAFVVEKLEKAGAVILGKTNMDEFAMGSSTEQSFFGITKNPLDLTRVAGGSSGGSAAAVASGMTCFALGSDTGGSIRQPASFCGVVGMKPTYGAVSRYGLMAMASSLDQIGPITRTVTEAETVFNLISGKDSKDSTSLDYSYALFNDEVRKLRIGIPKEYLTEGISKEVKEKVVQAITKAEKDGFEIQEVSLPHSQYALAVYYIIMPSEVSANMARYDGLKYGFSESKNDLISMYFNNRKEGLGAEVKRRIILGNFTLSSGYYDAYYKRAQKARALIVEDFKEVFKKVDLILAPVSPTLPFAIGERTKNPLEMYLSDMFTVNANLAGLPAISLPCGEVNGLSVGMQIMAPYFQENKMFKIGKHFEKLWNN